MEVSMIKIAWSKRILFFFPCTWVSLISFVTLDLFLHPALHLIFERSLDWLPSLREEVFAEPEEIIANRISGGFLRWISRYIFQQELLMHCLQGHCLHAHSLTDWRSWHRDYSFIKLWNGNNQNLTRFCSVSIDLLWELLVFSLFLLGLIRLLYILFYLKIFYLKIKKWQNFVKMILCLMNKENQMMDKIIKMMEIQ